VIIVGISVIRADFSQFAQYGIGFMDRVLLKANLAG
jgi:hypothetical protein